MRHTKVKNTGYTSCFFKKSWDIIGNEFMEAIEEFFASRSLLPKANHSTLVRGYRPIACCNLFYKVITSILSTRLRFILESIIDQAQAELVEDRSLIENIHLAQELLRQYNHNRVASRCLLKIDLKKANDSVN